MAELARHERANGDRQVVTDHPPIPPVEAELRRACMDRLHKATDPILWHPGDVVWSAVLTLHRAERHDDACALAKLLKWCDSHGHGYVWELVGDGAVRPEPRVPRVVDVELPALAVSDGE